MTLAILMLKYTIIKDWSDTYEKIDFFVDGMCFVLHNDDFNFGRFGYC